MIDRVDYSAIGYRLRQRRLEQRLTQAQLSERVDVSLSFIGQIERGEKVPSLETMAKLAQALETSLDFIVLGNKPVCVRDDCPLYREIDALLKSYGMVKEKLYWEL